MTPDQSRVKCLYYLLIDTLISCVLHSWPSVVRAILKQCNWHGPAVSGCPNNASYRFLAPHHRAVTPHPPSWNHCIHLAPVSLCCHGDPGLILEPSDVWCRLVGCISNLGRKRKKKHPQRIYWNVLHLTVWFGILALHFFNHSSSVYYCAHSRSKFNGCVAAN